jgi:hypothetical protein
MVLGSRPVAAQKEAVTMASLRFQLVLTMALCFVSASSPAQSAANQPYKVGTVVEVTFAADSAEARLLRRWIEENAIIPGGDVVGDFSSFGDVTIRRSLERHGAALDPSPGPPVPLPGNGQPGDTFVISTCSSGVKQQWSYVWIGSSSGGGWVLAGYQFERVRSCAGGA